MKKRLIFFLIALFTACQTTHQKQPDFRPGAVWNDTDGNPINAHSAGILFHDGKYYWFGEYKKGETRLVTGLSCECYRVDAGGVSCYSSVNLRDLKFVGIALAPTRQIYLYGGLVE